MAQAKAKGTPTAMITDDTPPGFSDNPKMVPEYAITWLVVIYPICEYVPVTCVQITMLIFQVMEGWRNILTLNVLLGNAFCLAYSSSKWLSATHYFYTESFFFNPFSCVYNFHWVSLCCHLPLFCKLSLFHLFYNLPKLVMFFIFWCAYLAVQVYKADDTGEITRSKRSFFHTHGE